MKRIVGIIYFFVLLTLIACTEKSNTEKGAQTISDKARKVVTDTNTNGVHNVDVNNLNALLLRMKQGDKFIMTFNFNHHIELILQSKADSIYNSQTAIQNNKVVYDCYVSEVAPNGDFTLDIEFIRITNNLSGSVGASSTFDTHSFKNIKDVPKKDKISYALIGKKYKVVLSPLGHLKKINGISDIKQKILNEIKPTKQENAAISNRIDKIFDFVEMSQFYKRLFNYTTRQDIELNKKWSNEYISRLDKVLVAEAKYEITQEDDNTLTIAVIANLIDKMPDLRKQYSSQVSGEITGSGVLKGELKVDRRTGMFSMINTTQNLKFIEKQTKKNAPNKIIMKKLNRKTDFSAVIKWK